jgi:hypothetical protein
MVSDSMRPDIEFEGMIDAFRQTIKKNGFIGLWRGTTANLVKVVPYAGTMFAVYETSKRFWLWWNGYSSSPLREIAIPGVDQGLNPPELKKWYQQQAAKGIDPHRGIPAPPPLQEHQQQAQSVKAASLKTSATNTPPKPTRP